MTDETRIKEWQNVRDRAARIAELATRRIDALKAGERRPDQKKRDS